MIDFRVDAEGISNFATSLTSRNGTVANGDVESESQSNSQTAEVTDSSGSTSPLLMESPTTSTHGRHTPNNTSNTTTNDNNNKKNDSSNVREGTITSARFNLLSSMVGGGSLSLPLAYQQAGNGLFAPLLLFFIAFCMDKSIYYLIQAGVRSRQVTNHNSNSSDPVDGTHRNADNDNANHNTNNNSAANMNMTVKGDISYESLVCQAFGPKARFVPMALVFTSCFFTIIGYGVLLRDMLLPLSDYLVYKLHNPDPDHNPDNHNHNDNTDTETSPTLIQNLTMLTVMTLITPLCTLQTLTALQNVGAASMLSVLTLFLCITYRSAQCNLSPSFQSHRHANHWLNYIHFVPHSFQNVLDSLPIFISVYMCHYNVLPVHNELQRPTVPRVKSLFGSAIWGSTVFYSLMGFVGSMYGNCTESGTVEGNILLSFSEEDDLMMVGRVCLSLTITFAFPVLVVPARDIVLRFMDEFDSGGGGGGGTRSSRNGTGGFGSSIRSGFKRLCHCCCCCCSAWFWNTNHNRSDNRGMIIGDLNLYKLETNDNNYDDDDDDVNYDGDVLMNDVTSVVSASLRSSVEASLGADNYHQNHQQLAEPLLALELDYEQSEVYEPQRRTSDAPHKSSSSQSWNRIRRIVVSIVIFWAGAAVACCVKSIDIVWDIMGSSLSLMLAFFIPCGGYLILTSSIMKDENAAAGVNDNDGSSSASIIRIGVDGHECGDTVDKISRRRRVVARVLIVFYIPIMIVCTVNSLYNTFWK